MAQYSIAQNKYVDRNNNLFEVVQQSDENGELVNKRYNKDAWGRPKSIKDFSLFSASWTFSVPERTWEESHISNAHLIGQEIHTHQGTFDEHVVSKDHMLSIVSGTILNEGHECTSKKHPRYQPNRGHIYSTAVTLPNPNDNGIRKFGLSTPRDGVYFQLTGNGTDWDLLAVRRKNNLIYNEVSIKEFLPAGFDPSKGHVYDIQFQWRGAGDYFFFVDLELVYHMKLLGTLDTVSVDDPALPAMYQCVNTDGVTDVEIKAGCVDIASEGGQYEKTLFNSLQSGLVPTVNSAETDCAILALKIPRNITYSGSSHYNSRGAIADKLVTWTKAEARTTIYVARDVNVPNLDALTWLPVNDSNMLQLQGGSGTALNTAFNADVANLTKISSEWQGIDLKNEIINPSTNSEFEITPGDILVVAVATVNGTGADTSANLYFSEEI